MYKFFITITFFDYILINFSPKDDDNTDNHKSC